MNRFKLRKVLFPTRTGLNKFDVNINRIILITLNYFNKIINLCHVG